MGEYMASTFKRGDVWYVRYIGVDGKWTQESCGKGVTKTQAEIIRNIVINWILKKEEEK